MGAVRRLTLSPRESRLTLRRRLLEPAGAGAEAGAGGSGGAAAATGVVAPDGAGGLRLPFQKSLATGHSLSSSGLVSR